MLCTDPNKLPDDVRHKLLLIRTAIVCGDEGEASHWLYSIACPSFTCLDPYAALEGRQCACGPHSLESTSEPPTCDELESVIRGRGAARYQAPAWPASIESSPLCPHGMPLDENVCGPCSEGRPNRPATEKPAAPPVVANWKWNGRGWDCHTCGSMTTDRSAIDEIMRDCTKRCAAGETEATPPKPEPVFQRRLANPERDTDGRVVEPEFEVEPEPDGTDLNF